MTRRLSLLGESHDDVVATRDRDYFSSSFRLPVVMMHYFNYLFVFFYYVIKVSSNSCARSRLSR
jgi:hypothetical protein